MNIAVLSGKGGTGKTTVSTNLALALATHYVDCDVEEPNGFIFLNPTIDSTQDVFIEVPLIDTGKCSLCGDCAKVCQFHALAKAGNEIVIFEKLCHSCGACKLVCKEGALTFKERSIGKLEKGNGRGIACKRGILNVGEPMAVPVIRALLEDLSKENHFIDCPPGTSCSVVNALRYADAALLVTEPSEFGLHDMNLAIEVVKLYQIPFGVVINKDDSTENMVKSYCNQNNIPLLGAIPYSKEAAVLYSNGSMLCDDQYYRNLFEHIAEKMKAVFRWN